MKEHKVNDIDYKKLMHLDFVFGVSGLLIAFFFINSSYISDIIMKVNNVSYFSLDGDFYSILAIRPLLIIYSIHRIYSGFKNMLMDNSKTERKENNK